MAQQGDLRIWWISHIETEKFITQGVFSVEEGHVMLNLLARYDLHLHKIGERKTVDYENAGGLEVFDGTDWVDWNENNDDLQLMQMEMESEAIH